MQTINHPNIIKLHEVIITKEHEYLVMNYCNKGDLR